MSKFSKKRRQMIQLMANQKLIELIQDLGDDEKEDAIKLLENMRYPRGKKEGKIISQYLQQQLVEIISGFFYRHQMRYSVLKEECDQLRLQNKKLNQKNEALIIKTKSLRSQNRHTRQKVSCQISEIRSLVRRSKQISSEDFKKQVKALFKSNDQHYSLDMIWLTTKLTQIGQVSMRATIECTKLIYEFLTGELPKSWLSIERITTWHKHVSELAVSNFVKRAQQSNAFGITADESTHGQDKNLVICFMYWDKDQNYPVAKDIKNGIINIHKKEKKTYVEEEKEF
ncbi:18215_t:CDS:2, partial [Cetraspora pellucida]